MIVEECLGCGYLDSAFCLVGSDLLHTAVRRGDPRRDREGSRDEREGGIRRRRRTSGDACGQLAMADEQLRRDGLLGESVHLARERARHAGGLAEPEPESEPPETSRAAEVAGLAAGVRELVRRDIPC